MTPEAKQWLDMAESDLRAAALVLDHGLQRIALFHCHEAVEKLLKAIWVEKRREEPERTHNLPYLANELALDLSEARKEFLRKLSWELIPSRYPEGPDPERQTVEWYYEQSRELVSWLRQTLK